jgi:hypothetical protein
MRQEVVSGAVMQGMHMLYSTLDCHTLLSSSTLPFHG